MIKEICGLVLGLTFLALAVLLCGMAWIGIEASFGWEWALAGVVLAVATRINVPVLVGLYFYGYGVMGWGDFESIVLALPGLLIVMPAVAIEMFGQFMRSLARH